MAVILSCARAGVGHPARLLAHPANQPKLRATSLVANKMGWILEAFAIDICSTCVTIIAGFNVSFIGRGAER